MTYIDTIVIEKKNSLKITKCDNGTHELHAQFKLIRATKRETNTSFEHKIVRQFTSDLRIKWT